MLSDVTHRCAVAILYRKTPAFVFVWGILALTALSARAAIAATPEASLPEPLTLEFALAFVDESHPDIEQALADLDLAVAREKSARSTLALNISAQARLRYIEPSDLATDRTHNDNSASIVARKRLYDFGRTGRAVDAAESDVFSQQWRFVDARNTRRIDIMARYFDVILADLRYSRDYEAMSIGFVRYDAARDRQKQGQVSEINVAELHSIYQDARLRWYESTAEQRNARVRFARAINWQGPLPSEFTMPDLKKQTLDVPALEVLQAQAMQTNPAIIAAREKVNAMLDRVQSARAANNPTLDFEAAASAYSRDLSARDKWLAGFVFDMPLYVGDKTHAEVAQQQAELRRSQAMLLAREQDINEELFVLHGRLTALRIQREDAKAFHDYRDLYLDRSRLLYEQEMRTDLGDAMVRQSEARLRDAETEFSIALVLARIESLVGQPVDQGK